MNKQSTSVILMVRPVKFGYNEQTATSNAFQDDHIKHSDIQTRALKEFDVFTTTLRAKGIEIIIIDDTAEPHTPDSVFPNNWISTHPEGRIILYPMEAENRRKERRDDVVDLLRSGFQVNDVTDLSPYELEGKYLEGTGSMVLDHANKIAYACISSRTNPDVLKQFCNLLNYSSVIFSAADRKGQNIYHTNVMMCIGETFSVICLDSIHDSVQRAAVESSLLRSGKEIIKISYAQLDHFAGNMIQLLNKAGEKLLVMSEQAYNSLSDEQLSGLEKHASLISSPLYSIEQAGGGSARCMIAEIFLNRTRRDHE